MQTVLLLVGSFTSYFTSGMAPVAAADPPGAFSTSSHNHHITTFSVPSAKGTVPQSINQDGEIVGTYLNMSNVSYGFVRDEEGTITTFSAMGAAQGTFPTSINDTGAITGNYQTTYNVIHGFVLRP